MGFFSRLFKKRSKDNNETLSSQYEKDVQALAEDEEIKTPIQEEALTEGIDNISKLKDDLDNND